MHRNRKTLGVSAHGTSGGMVHRNAEPAGTGSENAAASRAIIAAIDPAAARRLIMSTSVNG